MDHGSFSSWNERLVFTRHLSHQPWKPGGDSVASYGHPFVSFEYVDLFGLSYTNRSSHITYPRWVTLTLRLEGRELFMKVSSWLFEYQSHSSQRCCFPAVPLQHGQAVRRKTTLTNCRPTNTFASRSLAFPQVLARQPQTRTFPRLGPCTIR